MMNSATNRTIASAPMKRMLALFTITSLLGAVLALAMTVLNPSPAEAAPKVSISGTAKPNEESSLELSGSGFQSVEGGFGGVYVLFGWVDDPSGGNWRPSKGGATGTNYRYVYDDETNPTGYQVFVAFPGSSTEYAANGGKLAANGSWNATIRIPGSSFTSYDRAQNEAQVDCTDVQCGIITIGAHGVTNANNESFTPIDFSAPAAAPAGDAEKKQEEASGGDEKNAETGSSEGGEAPAENTAQSPAVAPASSQPLMSTSWLIFFAVLAGVLVIGAIIAIGLGFGIGGYLAVKSLLLGVSPSALEKERDRREKKRIRTKHRLQKRRIKMQRRKKLQLAKLERGSERALAQTSHQDAGSGHDRLPPQVIAFFENEKAQAEPEPAGDEAETTKLPVTHS